MSLSTNWRQSTGNFISDRDGDDATGNGSQANPYKTIQQAFANDNVLRAGYYTGVAGVSGGSQKLIADGFVVWDASGQIVSNSSTDGGLFQGLRLVNHIEIRLYQAYNAAFGTNVKNCEFVNATAEGRLREGDFIFSRQGSSFVLSERFQDSRLFRGTFVNSSLSFAGVSSVPTIEYINCFFDDSSSITGSSSNSTFNNCAFGVNGTQCQVFGGNIKDVTLSGDIDTIGNTYASNERFSGTVTIGAAVITFTNCFYTDDPLFNNSAIGDYTLTPASPLVNGLNIIGRYSVALPLNAQSAPFTDAGASYTNVTPTGTKFILDVGQTEGTVTSTDSLTNCITLPFPTTVSEAVQAFGTFLYNQGEWIDKENYNPATNQEVRLTWEFSALDENTLIWGPFVNYEVGLPLETDNAGLGNGNVNADMADLGAITAKRFRVRFTIRTNGV